VSQGQLFATRVRVDEIPALRITHEPSH
jgi:hypothetical protein